MYRIFTASIEEYYAQKRSNKNGNRVRRKNYKFSTCTPRLLIQYIQRIYHSLQKQNIDIKCTFLKHKNIARVRMRMRKIFSAH